MVQFFLFSFILRLLRSPVSIRLFLPRVVSSEPTESSLFIYFNKRFYLFYLLCVYDKIKIHSALFYIFRVYIHLVFYFLFSEKFNYFQNHPTFIYTFGSPQTFNSFHTIACHTVHCTHVL